MGCDSQFDDYKDCGHSYTEAWRPVKNYGDSRCDACVIERRKKAAVEAERSQIEFNNQLQIVRDVLKNAPEQQMSLEKLERAVLDTGKGKIYYGGPWIHDCIETLLKRKELKMTDPTMETGIQNMVTLLY